MKILMVNKFLHPNGGSETYIFKLGQALTGLGHQVQYFGMDHQHRCVGNRVNAYTANMDFHGGSRLARLTYPVKLIYSQEARRQLRRVLEDFQPDVCHLNNFHYQLTPSILLEIRKWEREAGRRVKIVMTAHDGQLICPNHMMRNPNTHENCEKCASGAFFHCTLGSCIHGSRARSLIGTAEAWIWNGLGIYRELDAIICPSAFLKSRLDQNPVLARKTLTMHNFIEDIPWKAVPKQDYVLYFGRYSREKGIETLLRVCRELPEVSFVFAGTGPLEAELEGISNVRNAGFQTGEALADLIRQARFAVCPSECYENCPFSVMESQAYGTPVLAADIGGIPELIRPGRTGELFESGNEEMLKAKIQSLWEQKEKTAQLSENCADISFDTISRYCDRLMEIYCGHQGPG